MSLDSVILARPEHRSSCFSRICSKLNPWKLAYSPSSSWIQKFGAGIAIGTIVQPLFATLGAILTLANKEITPEIKYSFVGSVIIMPIVEEVIFRKLVQGGIQKLQRFLPQRLNCLSGQSARVLITASAFGLIHLLNGGEGGYHTWEMAKIQSIYATIAGLYLCHLKEKTGNIAVPLAVHMALNYELITVSIGSSDYR